MTKRTKSRRKTRTTKTPTASSHLSAMRRAGARRKASGLGWSPDAARLDMYDAGIAVSKLSPDERATLEAIHHHAHATASRTAAPGRAAPVPRQLRITGRPKKATKKATKKAPKKATKKASKAKKGRRA